MKKDFTFPPSIQSDLFSYLKPQQQEVVKPILRVLKKSAQEELCCTLLDYMEQGHATPPSDFTLAAIYMYLTHESFSEGKEKAIIKPLSSAGESAGESDSVSDSDSDSDSDGEETKRLRIFAIAKAPADCRGRRHLSPTPRGSHLPSPIS